LKSVRRYFTGDHRIRLLLGTLVLLVASDGLISQFLVSQRFGVEANPFLQNWIGKEEFLVIKLIGALVAAFVLWDIHKQNYRLAFVSTVLFVISYTAIIFWNLSVFFVARV